MSQPIKPWFPCSCPSCKELNAKCPDGWCARCGACLPGANYESMDCCAECEVAMRKESSEETTRNQGPPA